MYLVSDAPFVFGEKVYFAPDVSKCKDVVDSLLCAAVTVYVRSPDGNIKQINKGI